MDVKLGKIGLAPGVACKCCSRSTKIYWALVVMVSDRNSHQRGQRKFHTLLGNASHSYYPFGKVDRYKNEAGVFCSKVDIVRHSPSAMLFGPFLLGFTVCTIILWA